MPRAPKKAGLLDHMGGGNLADDATQIAVIHNIKNRWRDAEVIGVSMNPYDTQKRHGIPSYPIRKQTWHAGPPGVCEPETSYIPLKPRVNTGLSKYRSLLNLLRTTYAERYGCTR
jgi:hypothetical protein